MRVRQVNVVISVIVGFLLCFTSAEAAFTKIQSNTTVADGSATTVAVSLTGVTAGNLIVCFIKGEGGSVSITVSDGTSTLADGTRTDSTSGGAQFSYLLSANGGNRTYTATFGAAQTFRRIFVIEFSYTGGSTGSLDAQNTGSGTSTAPASGTITTTGTDEVVLGFYVDFSGQLSTSEQINGVAADFVLDNPAVANDAMWYRILSATFSGGTASATIAVSGEWICNVIAIKATAAGGGGAGNAVPFRSLLGVGQ